MLRHADATRSCARTSRRGAIDTVVVAFTDMQGRLMGKRLHAEFFLEEMDAGHGVEGCNYLLALDMEMDPVPGYAIASWEQGYGDFDARPDLGDAAPDPVARGDRARALRRRSGTTARRSQPSPRQVLKAQVERAAALGFDADDRLRARVLPPPRDVRGGAREAVLATSRRRCRTSSTTTSSRRPTTSRSCARSGTGCRPPACASRRRRARRGRASRRSTSASPTR